MRSVQEKTNAVITKWQVLWRKEINTVRMLVKELERNTQRKNRSKEEKESVERRETITKKSQRDEEFKNEKNMSVMRKHQRGISDNKR